MAVMCISSLQNDVCPGLDASGQCGRLSRVGFLFSVCVLYFDGSLLHTWLGVCWNTPISFFYLSRKYVVQTHDSLQVVLLRVRAKTVVGTLHYGVNCSLQYTCFP